MLKHLMICGLMLLWPTLAMAAVTGVQLDLGGTGADGPMNITADTTLALPADGVFQVTTLTVAAGATLTFTHNARNTGVIIVSQGDVVIDGTIDVSGAPGTIGFAGKGGPGGGDGGSPTVCPADNYYAYAPLAPDTIANARGSGGGNGSYNYGMCCSTAGAGGGGGGGALVIFSNTVIRSTKAGAQINAGGGGAPKKAPSGNGCEAMSVNPGAGTDGVVRLVSPTLDAANLTIVANAATLQRLFPLGTPTGMTSSYAAMIPGASVAMDAFVPNPTAVTIVSVDGQALSGGSESFNYMYTPASTTTTVVTKVTGCAGQLNVTLIASGFVTACSADNSTFSKIPNATSTWTCNLAVSPSAARLFAYATCNQ